MNAAMHFLISYWVKHRLTRNRERGATAVEYSLLAGLIALVIIAVVGALGGQIVALIQPAVTALGG